MNGKIKRTIIYTAAAAALACLICALTLGENGTLGWLMPVETAENRVAVSDFTVEGKAAFGGDQPVEDLSGLDIHLSRDAANYLGNLKYTVKYTGISPVYLRVRILEQWVDRKTDTVVAAPFTQYNIAGEGWYDNRANDSCFYYKGTLGPAVLPGGVTPSAVTLPLFDGVDMSDVVYGDDDTKFTLFVEVQAVQPNRYRELWNLDYLPWETPAV